MRTLSIPRMAFCALVAAAFCTACSAGSAGGAGAADGGSDGDSPVYQCSGLCTRAGFSGGGEIVPANGPILCTCSGGSPSAALDIASCEAFCARRMISKDNAQIATNDQPNDQCRCNR